MVPEAAAAFIQRFETDLANARTKHNLSENALGEVLGLFKELLVMIDAGSAPVDLAGLLELFPCSAKSIQNRQVCACGNICLR